MSEHTTMKPGLGSDTRRATQRTMVLKGRVISNSTLVATSPVGKSFFSRRSAG
jgi:hypothetical protein